MARPKDSYIIEVHYPKSQGGLIELRRRLGKAYIEFIKGYIMGLPICGEEKDELYIKIIERIRLNGENCD
ncbi:hypothetical protein [Pseudobacteroides cellulosolvens]|uniref:Uncharacterized protein n=1 Tax=Pseudobacteroides cellulosolvens ATCC 35603 = DSM 2933 TaxID=398512 RepID=A0A0L6JGP2_9FIRM|nr:hypothetical protein [Pseudobacteroides cellulosolvens]KNY24883.1 hypothetical protein Bccel_0140 [Pseudobacteroides cellulosolvens ATCC 35603 = DSM 2933]